MNDNIEDPSPLPLSGSGADPESEGQRSASWLDIFDWQIPFAILVLTLLITNVIQLVGLLDQSKQLSSNKGQIDQGLQRAEVYRSSLESLARDLVELAKTDPDARQIQDELIKINNPPATNPPAAPAPQ